MIVWYHILYMFYTYSLRVLYEFSRREPVADPYKTRKEPVGNQVANETEIAERALVQLADHTGLRGTWNLTNDQFEKGIDGSIDLDFESTRTSFLC